MSDHEGIILGMKDKMKDPSKGWIFRTDTSTSDVVLGYNGTVGVSRRHFAIFIDIEGECTSEEYLSSER